MNRPRPEIAQGLLMETTIVYIGVIYWGYIGIMENKMETTIWVVLQTAAQSVYEGPG